MVGSLAGGGDIHREMASVYADIQKGGNAVITICRTDNVLHASCASFAALARPASIKRAGSEFDCPPQETSLTSVAGTPRAFQAWNLSWKFGCTHGDDTQTTQRAYAPLSIRRADQRVGDRHRLFRSPFVVRNCWLVELQSLAEAAAETLMQHLDAAH